jgi:hypothetical protein
MGLADGMKVIANWIGQKVQWHEETEMTSRFTLSKQKETEAFRRMCWERARTFQGDTGISTADSKLEFRLL